MFLHVDDRPVVCAVANGSVLGWNGQSVCKRSKKCGHLEPEEIRSGSGLAGRLQLVGRDDVSKPFFVWLQKVLLIPGSTVWKKVTSVRRLFLRAVLC